MGNVIVMAVRHSELDAIAGMSFKDLARYRHRSDTIPKEFSGSPSWIAPGHYQYQQTAPGVAFSDYNNSNSSFCLYVDGQIMVRPGHLSFRLSHLNSESPVDITSVVTKVRSDIRHRPTPLSLLSGKGKISRDVMEHGAKVSLFMIYTDHMSSAEKNPHTMEDVAEYCRTGIAPDRTFGHSTTGISPIGTLAENEACLLVVRDYHGVITTLPRHRLIFSEDEKQSIASLHGASEWGQAMDEAEFLVTREICAASGFDFFKSPVKPAKI